MKPQIITLRDLVVKGKFYLNRSSSYLGIINLALLLNLSFTNMYLRIMFTILGLAGLILFGYLDVHVIKSYEKENNYIHANTPIHPIFHEMNDRIKRMEQHGSNN